MTTNIEFRYLDPELYRHPGEREARERLKKIPGFAKAMEMLSDNSGAKAERQAEIASTVRAGPGVYPQLADLWNDIQNRFGLNGVPLHIAFDPPAPIAIHGGNDSPTVTLDSCLLDELDEAEMRPILAMQAGSIRLGNASYLMAADFLRWFLSFGVAGVPAALPAWGMENWRRYALFSADRAAALSQGNPEAVTTLLEYIAGAGSKSWGGVARPDDLRIQGIEALSHERDWSNSKIRRFALSMNRQNNVALIRRLDLLDWFASGIPAKILSGEITRPEGAEAGPRAENKQEAARKDPGLAYWGEFAADDSESEDEKCFFGACPMDEAVKFGEKGIDAFRKAGEAFWNTLRDKK